MIWYVIILAIVISISFASKEDRLVYSNGEDYSSSSISYIGFIAIAVILILFEGLRSSTVGSDTGGYCRGFMFRTSQWWNLDFSTVKVLLEEPGLTAIDYFSELFTRNYISFLLVASTIMVTCSLIGIKNASVNFTASLFVYITLAFYLFGFAGLRQGLAISVFILSYKYTFNGEFKKYLLVVLIAALFHKSIVVAIPAYFVARLEYNKKNILLIILGAMFVGGSMRALLNYGSTMEERYEYYLQSTAAGSGSLLTIFSVCLTIFYIIQRNKIDVDRLPYYDNSLIMLIISSGVYLIVTLTGSNTELNRFAFYFQTGAIFLFAEYANACKNLGQNQILIAASIVHITYFIAYVNLIGGIANYTLNPIVNLV